MGCCTASIDSNPPRNPENAISNAPQLQRSAQRAKRVQRREKDSAVGDSALRSDPASSRRARVALDEWADVSIKKIATWNRMKPEVIKAAASTEKESSSTHSAEADPKPSQSALSCRPTRVPDVLFETAGAPLRLASSSAEPPPHRETDEA